MVWASTHRVDLALHLLKEPVRLGRVVFSCRPVCTFVRQVVSQTKGHRDVWTFQQIQFFSFGKRWLSGENHLDDSQESFAGRLISQIRAVAVHVRRHFLDGVIEGLAQRSGILFAINIFNHFP